MVAVRTRWSILALEDNRDLRETLKSHFAALFDDAVTIEFAGSICQAVDLVKRRMAQGLPYDAFWIDLYLDYFSYTNAHGEIVAASSFSQIVDTTAFLRQYGIAELSPLSLAAVLQLDITPAYKNLTDYSFSEKLLVLQRFLPFGTEHAKSCFHTLLALLETYLHSDSCASDNLENIYTRHALDSVFRLLINWVSNSQKQFSLAEENFDQWHDLPNVPALPSAEDKSDQSWTIFRDWVRRFYQAVALGAKEFEDLTAVNPLLLELQRLAPNNYPQFLINTAYEGRRQNLLESAAVWGENDLIITGNSFKGEKKDRAFAEYLSRLFCRLRRPYLFMRSRRRGTHAFLLDEKFLNPAFILNKDAQLLTPMLHDADFGLQFTFKSFFPDFAGGLQKITGAPAEFFESLHQQAFRDLEEALRGRQPLEINLLRFYLPATFLRDDNGHSRFRLKLQTVVGKEYEKELTFDEGRWLFLELVCRRWFPKCFYIHSRWTAFANGADEPVYFFSASELLTRALRHAALDLPKLFPIEAAPNLPAALLQPTASFYNAETTYLSAFDWPAFFETTFAAFDHGQQTESQHPLITRAQRLIHLAKYLSMELKIHRVADKLFDRRSFTPSELCKILENGQFGSTAEKLEHFSRLVQQAAKTPSLIAEDYLPSMQNFLAVILCFYSLPVEPMANFYHFWLKKDIPPGGTRPTEKFSTISKKIYDFQFTKSLELPAQAAGKSNFLIIPASLKANQLHLFLSRGRNGLLDNENSEQSVDLCQKSHDEFFSFLHHSAE